MVHLVAADIHHRAPPSASSGARRCTHRCSLGACRRASPCTGLCQFQAGVVRTDLLNAEVQQPWLPQLWLAPPESQLCATGISRRSNLRCSREIADLSMIAGSIRRQGTMLDVQFNAVPATTLLHGTQCSNTLWDRLAMLLGKWQLEIAALSLVATLGALYRISSNSVSVFTLPLPPSSSTVYLSLHTHNHTLTHTPYHLYLLL